jgi:uncharacterized protein YecE (DUF72 family)
MPQDQQVRTPSIRIGCSGWRYKHWHGSFYPTSRPQSRWLESYAGQFDTVEINNTFYRLPEAPTFAAWARRVPHGFVYAVKASRYLTHMKKLKDPKESLSRLFTPCEIARRHAGSGPLSTPISTTTREDTRLAMRLAFARGSKLALGGTTCERVPDLPQSTPERAENS